MARLVHAYREAPHQCQYLADRDASLDVRVLTQVSPAELGALLERGWRRFGPTYFRPACAGCQACLPLRIPVSTFDPSASQRRARRGASRLARTVSTPVVDDERLSLYHRWHAQRESRRGWDSSPMDAERYAFDFAFGHPSAREVTFRDPADGHRLVGLGIVDDVPGALSAVYFFWDPDCAPPSLGVAHVVMLVDEARSRGLDHVYLGYWVKACPSLSYKGRYRPHQILQGRPSLKAMAVWLDPAPAADEP